MSFSRVIGQERVIEILQRFFSSNRFPQALVFYGPSGIGKRTVALELAKVFNCETQITANKSITRMDADKNQTRMQTNISTDIDGKDYLRQSAFEVKKSAVISVVDACDKCLSCQKIDKGIHPDVRIISPEKDTIGIDQIRNLNWETQWRPFEGKYKIYIIEKVEKMTAEAVNSFLKNLEEPPVSVIFILLSENRDILPATILSRCWELPFSYLSDKMISGIFSRSEREISGLQNFFAGRIQGIIFNKEFPLLYQKFGKFLDSISSLRENELFDLSEKYSKDRTKEETEEFLNLLLLLAREKRYWETVELINQTKNQIRRNLNRRLVLDCLFLKLRSLCQ